MKLLVILMSLMLYINAWTQINTNIKAKKVTGSISHKGRQVEQAGIAVFPIVNAVPAATPISIPSPNKEPLKLKPYNSMGYFSNHPASVSISGCSILRITENGMILRIYHKFKNYKPIVYAGAWLYDAHGKALDVGYIPEAVSEIHTGFTDVKMTFGSLPVISDYVEVILMKDGKTLLKKMFKMAFQWKKMGQYAEADLEKLEDIDLSKLIFQAPDLEITTVKSIDSDLNTVDFNKNCTNSNKIIFITNTGDKSSASYQVKIGYFKKLGARMEKYILLKIVDRPVLLPNKQTLIFVDLSQEANNIQVEIIYNNGDGGEVNKSNNKLRINCH